MNIALRITRWLLAIGISAALSLWIFLATINATVANRDVVKGWLARSGAYDAALHSFLRISPKTQPDPLLRDSAQQALEQTFSGAFIHQSTEAAVDASYNWLEGSANTITFTIPLQEKEVEFYANLSNILAPKLRELPACATRVPVSTATITCLPPGIDAASYASQITRPASGDGLLKKPLTHETFASAPTLPWLPMAVQWLHISLWGLPLVILLFGLLYMLASPDRIRGVGHIARRLTLGAAITLVGGAFMWFTGTAINLSGAIDTSDPGQTEQQQAIVDMVMNPIARTVLPDVGQALALYSSLVVGIAGAMWLGVVIWRHKRNSSGPASPTQPPQNTNGPNVPPPPTNPQESQLPTPLARP